MVLQRIEGCHQCARQGEDGLHQCVVCEVLVCDDCVDHGYDCPLCPACAVTAAVVLAGVAPSEVVEPSAEAQDVARAARRDWHEGYEERGWSDHLGYLWTHPLGGERIN